MYDISGILVNEIFSHPPVRIFPWVLSRTRVSQLHNVTAIYRIHFPIINSVLVLTNLGLAICRPLLNSIPAYADGGRKLNKPKLISSKWSLMQLAPTINKTVLKLAAIVMNLLQGHCSSFFVQNELAFSSKLSRRNGEKIIKDRETSCPLEGWQWMFFKKHTFLSFVRHGVLYTPRNLSTCCRRPSTKRPRRRRFRVKVQWTYSASPRRDIRKRGDCCHTYVYIHMQWQRNTRARFTTHRWASV